MNRRRKNSGRIRKVPESKYGNLASPDYDVVQEAKRRGEGEVEVYVLESGYPPMILYERFPDESYDFGSVYLMGEMYYEDTVGSPEELAEVAESYQGRVKDHVERSLQIFSRPERNLCSRCRRESRRKRNASTDRAREEVGRVINEFQDADALQDLAMEDPEVEEYRRRIWDDLKGLAKYLDWK